MNPANKTLLKLTARQKRDFRKRAHALRGKYKGKGLMKALMAEKKREREL